MVLWLALLAGQSARTDDILEFEPVPAAPTLLLSHLIQEHVATRTYSYYMSRISTSKKIHSSWKISDSSRIYPSEESIRDIKLVLPEKFSPSKGTPRHSKIFTASKEKLQLVRGRSPCEPCVTPTKRDSSQLLNQLSLKESVPLAESPQRVRTEQALDLKSRESLVLQNLQSDSPSPKRKSMNEINYELLKSQQELNLRTIHQIRVDFIGFKAQVWAELVTQKETIAKIAAEISAKVQEGYATHARQVISSFKPLGEAVEQIKIEEAAKQVEQVGQRIEHFSNHIEKKFSELRLDCIEMALSPPATPQAKNIEQCRTPIQKLSQVNRMPQRRSTPLDKCNHIVQTIGILSEINSSPVNNRAKSIERINIEQYKQKLIAVSRSNDQLIKESLRVQLRDEGKVKEESKLKGSFKLDKFYNAIEKLKEEVNEIRNINDMKQIKKLKILKVHE